MSTLNQYIVFDKNQFTPRKQSNFSPVYPNPLNIITNEKYFECNLNNNGHNINQYDKPNQFYKIGPYVLDQIIGKGNFSVVKSAIHVPTQSQVAIKILHKSKMSKETLEKTYREVHIMKQLNHPYIVKLYQIIESVDWLFIVMEYAWNGELFDKLSEVGRFSERDARTKFGQILDAVDHCHSMNIVHRDLKAENLLLDKQYNIKLADFGFGSYYENSFLLSTWCGSPPYAAPELFKGEPYNGPKADVWSLGVILYAMVCGTLPFDEPTNIVKLREQVLSGWVRFPYFLSYDCEHLIRMILNRNPLKRPTIEVIKNHKWMQPVIDNSVVGESSNYSDGIWGSPSQICNTQRCNTLGGDSGFDEPIGNCGQQNLQNRSILQNVESKEFDFNEHSIQIMERCGINRADIYDDLVNKKYGSHSATYFLLCERLRAHRQSYPPLKQECSSKHGSFFVPPKSPYETLNSATLMSNNLQNKPQALNILENINNDFKCFKISERQSLSNEIHFPYENLQNNFNITDNLFILQSENDRLNNVPSRQSNVEQVQNSLMNMQNVNQIHLEKNTGPVVVETILSQDEALKEISNCNNTSDATATFPVNKKVPYLLKSGLSDPSEYLFSYPGEMFDSRNHPTFTSPKFVVINPSRNLKDIRFQNGIKSNNNSQIAESFNQYSNVYPLQSNMTYNKYVNLNQNTKFASNINSQSISPRRVMTGAQSINAPPGSYNCSYNTVLVDNYLQEQQSKNCPAQLQVRNQCSDSHLPSDDRTINPSEFSIKEVEVKDTKLIPVLRQMVQPKTNCNNLKFMKSFNPPFFIRSSNNSQCNEEMIPYQFPPQHKERYSLSEDRSNFSPVKEVSAIKRPAFNITPTNNFGFPDGDFANLSKF